MDLTKSFPRSAREKLDGIDILARAIDKGRAELEGKLGDYIFFNCGVNKVLFTTLGVSDQQFLDAVKASPDDAGVVRWIHDTVKPDRAKLDQMNERFEKMKPETSDAKAYFAKELAGTGTKRTDIETYADLLDLQEGRIPV